MKLSLVISYSIALIGGLSYLFYGNKDGSLVPVMILGAKFGISSTFNLAYLANVYLYPPTLSSTAFGICNIFARVATIVAPLLTEIKDPVPMAVFTALTGVALISSLFIIPK
jgi:hypothetical protein